MSARDRLIAVLTETGLIAKKSLGQNFLVSDTVISRIHQAVLRTEPERLIEVGPGPGALTSGLLDMKKPLTLIELDRTMAAYWRGKGLEVLEDDALKVDWKPLLLPGTVLVSNLPYQISSSIVIDRSLDENGVGHMVLMFQKEVAQRLRAMPSTENYGLLSVIAQNFWEMELVSEAGPRDFDPPPRVASRVLGFHRKADAVANRKGFLVFVKAAFSQRRKLLKSNLAGWLHDHRAAPEKLLAKLAEFGLKETARAEELSPARFRELYEYLDHSGK